MLSWGILSSDRASSSSSSSSSSWFACDDKNNTKRTRLWTATLAAMHPRQEISIDLASREESRCGKCSCKCLLQPFSVFFSPCSSAVEGSCHSLHPWRTGSEFSDNTRRSSPCPQIPWIEKWAKNGTVRYGKPRWPFYGPKTVFDAPISSSRFGPHNQTRLEPAKRQAVVL